MEYRGSFDLRIQDSEFRDQGSGIRDQGSGIRDWASPLISWRRPLRRPRSYRVSASVRETGREKVFDKAAHHLAKRFTLRVDRLQLLECDVTLELGSAQPGAHFGRGSFRDEHIVSECRVGG